MTINERLFGSLPTERGTQKRLADALGIAARTIGAWQVRGTDPPANLILPIANFLGVSVLWLLTGEDQGENVASHITGSAFVQGLNTGSVVVRNGGERALSAEAAEMLRLYESLDVKRRMRLLDAAFGLEEEIKKI